MVGSLGSSTGINVCRGNRPLSLRFLLTCGSSNHVGFHKNKRKNSHSPSSVSSHVQKAARSWLSSAWPSICYDPNFHKRPSPLAVLTAPLPLVFSLAQPVGSCHDRHAHLLLFPPLPKLADSFLFQRLYHQTQTDLFILFYRLQGCPTTLVLLTHKSRAATSPVGTDITDLT